MEEGLLPHQRSIVDGKSIDEERRLAYVGVTRAQDSLTLTFCKERMKWGKPRAQIPSRFLMEMRGETERAKKAAAAAVLMFRTPEGGAVESRPAAKAPAKKTSAKDGTTRQKARAPGVILLQSLSSCLSSASSFSSHWSRVGLDRGLRPPEHSAGASGQSSSPRRCPPLP